jgi:chromate transporter
MYGALPFWDRFRTNARARNALNGVNAAVVGILGAALYNPVWVSSIGGPLDAAFTVLAFAALTVMKLPVLPMVVLSAAWGIGVPALA